MNWVALLQDDFEDPQPFAGDRHVGESLKGMDGFSNETHHRSIPQDVSKGSSATSLTLIRTPFTGSPWWRVAPWFCPTEKTRWAKVLPP